MGDVNKENEDFNQQFPMLGNVEIQKCQEIKEAKNWADVFVPNKGRSL